MSGSSSSPYLKEDERVVVWETQLQARLEDFHLSTNQEVYSGSLMRRANPIG